MDRSLGMQHLLAAGRDSRAVKLRGGEGSHNELRGIHLAVGVRVVRHVEVIPPALPLLTLPMSAYEDGGAIHPDLLESRADRSPGGNIMCEPTTLMLKETTTTAVVVQHYCRIE